MNDWIDYDESGYTDEESIRWSHRDLVNYWKHLQKVPVKWGIKETTLLSKLMKVYSSADIGDMMQWYVEHKPVHQATNFGLFYTQSEVVFDQVDKERKGWSWD